MTETFFRCDSEGNLWFNGWERGNDDHARQQMERQARFFAAQPKRGRWASTHARWAEECKQALIDYDAYWLEDDEQLRYETEMGS